MGENDETAINTRALRPCIITGRKRNTVPEPYCVKFAEAGRFYLNGRGG